MADYSMVGSFSSGGAAALNGDLITKLREAEEKATVKPIETSIEDIGKEEEKMVEIAEKFDALLNSISVFDLYNSGSNAFNQISASTTGSSAIFDAVDLGSLDEGTLSVTVDFMAEKDVFQSNSYTKAQKDETDPLDIGTLTVTVDGTDKHFDTSTMSLTELANNLDGTEGISASIEEVGTDSYRLVIKSTETGVDNALVIKGTAADDLGYALDELGTDNPTNHVQTARNLEATIDGIFYDVSSNSVTVDGNLKITATDTGNSTISIQKDSSYVVPAIQEMATSYNELTMMINEEIYSEDSPIEDKSSLRSMLDNLKSMFFDNYGATSNNITWGTKVDENGDTLYDHSNVTNNEFNVFSYGMEFDSDGYLLIDETKLGKALNENFDDIKNMFIGVAENEGLGTQLNGYISELSLSDGMLSSYIDSMTERKTNLEEEQEAAIEDLDTKYSLMQSQFIEYGSIIAQMEASFSGLKQMMAESTSD